jgi:hypothetical protein
MDQTQVNSPEVSLRILPSLNETNNDDDDTAIFQPFSTLQSASSRSALTTAAENIAALSRSTITSLSGNMKLRDLVESSTESERVGRASLELGDLERQMRADLEGVRLSNGQIEDSSDLVGSEVRRDAREQGADVRRVLSGRTSSYEGTPVDPSFSPSRAINGGHKRSISDSSQGPEMNGGELEIYLVFQE